MRDIHGVGEMAHLVAENSVSSIFSRFKDMAEGKRHYFQGNMGPLQNEFINRGDVHARSAKALQPTDGQSVSGLESLRMGNDRIRQTGYAGNVQGIGGLIKGFGQGSPYRATPGEGMAGRRGMIPRAPLEIGALHGQMTGVGFGELPAKSDTRGYRTSDFIQKIAGHVEGATGDALKYGEMMAAHGKDSFKIGSDKYPTSYYVVKRSRSTKGGGGKTDWERRYDLKKGQFEQFTNDENKLQDTDIDLFVTLLWVGLSDEEMAAETQAKQDAASRLAKEKSDCEAAMAAATAAVNAYKNAGGDASGFEKSMFTANSAYANGSYGTASSISKQVAIDAQSAYGLLQKQNLDKQANTIKTDPTISADTKAQMLKDITDQKSKVDQQTGAAIAQTQASLKGVAMPAIPGLPGWATLAIIGGAVAVIGGAIWYSRRRR